MAFNNVDQLNLGKFLQIVFTNGIRNQISEDYRDWEMIKSVRESNSVARELRFLFQKSLGPAAVQYRDPGTSGRSFPTAQQSTTSENIAKYKEINTTVELEYNLLDRARKSPEKYAEPLAIEISSKSTASKRRLAADLYADGSGVVGQASAAGVVAAGRVTFTLDTANTARGFIGFFEYGDLLIASQLDSTPVAAPTVSSGTFYAYRIESKDRDADSVTLSAINAAGNELTITADTVAATNVFYRVGQPTQADLTAPITDWGTMTEVIAGLESLTANDGRIIHGIQMSGSCAGSRIDAQGNPLDVTYIQKALDNVKLAVGQDRYKFKKMCMAPESHATLIDSRENDRRFHTVEDNKRGIRYFAYMHGNDVVETYTSEYCPKKRIYMLPESSSNSEKVLEWHGSDFETVKGPGMDDFHLKPATGGGHVNNVISYLQAVGVLIAKHPASIAVLHNFS